MYLVSRPFCWYQVQGHLSKSRSNTKVKSKKKKKNGRCSGIRVSQIYLVFSRSELA